MQETIALLLARYRDTPTDETLHAAISDEIAALDQPDRERCDRWFELIQVQLDLRDLYARGANQTDEEIVRAVELRARECELLGPRVRPLIGADDAQVVASGELVLSDEWFPFEMALRGMLGLDGSASLEPELDLGFVETLDCATPRWIRWGDELLRWLPIRAVHLWSPPMIEAGPAGLTIARDPRVTFFTIQALQEAQRPGELPELTVCRLRWPQMAQFTWPGMTRPWVPPPVIVRQPDELHLLEPGRVIVSHPPQPQPPPPRPLVIQQQEATPEPGRMTVSSGHPGPSIPPPPVLTPVQYPEVDLESGRALLIVGGRMSASLPPEIIPQAVAEAALHGTDGPSPHQATTAPDERETT